MRRRILALRSVVCRAHRCRGGWSLHPPGTTTAGREPVDDVFRRRQCPATQSVDADHAGQRRTARRAMDVSDRRTWTARSDAARRGRQHVSDRPRQPRVGARRENRPPALALPAPAAGAPEHLLRARQPRLCDPRRSPVHDDARRPPRVSRRQDGKCPVRRRDRRSHEKLHRHRCTAHRQGQGHRRNRGSRVRHPRLHRCVRCEHRNKSVAILDRA